MKQYFCTRPRLYTFLINKGFRPTEVVPHFDNPNYHVWVFDKTPELEEAVEAFFNR